MPGLTHLLAPQPRRPQLLQTASLPSSRSQLRTFPLPPQRAPLKLPSIFAVAGPDILALNLACADEDPPAGATSMVVDCLNGAALPSPYARMPASGQERILQELERKNSLLDLNPVCKPDYGTVSRQHRDSRAPSPDAKPHDPATRAQSYAEQHGAPAPLVSSSVLAPSTQPLARYESGMSSAGSSCGSLSNTRSDSFASSASLSSTGSFGTPYYGPSLIPHQSHTSVSYGPGPMSSLTAHPAGTLAPTLQSPASRSASYAYQGQPYPFARSASSGSTKRPSSSRGFSAELATCSNIVARPLSSRGAPAQLSYLPTSYETYKDQASARKRPATTVPDATSAQTSGGHRATSQIKKRKTAHVHFGETVKMMGVSLYFELEQVTTR